MPWCSRGRRGGAVTADWRNAAPAGDPRQPAVTRGRWSYVHATGELRVEVGDAHRAVGGGSLRLLRLLDAGASVKAGDVIAEFDPSEQQYALEQARSELEEAEQQIVKKKSDLEV